MPIWAWVVIWAVLVLGSLGYFGWIGSRLIAKAQAAAKAAGPIIAQLEALQQATSAPVSYVPNGDNLLDDPTEHIANQLRLSKARRVKAEARQRRLRNKLIDLDVTESEFRNEP
ncbi:hypothetical protein [Rhodoluna sp.]|uniref:hypothetical protein n=1 Tax=Rhodoluna sp. TaxID=1969481 RepID=UPI0025D139B1|nr:hypothetical protein [Rhodoluna sp.]